MAIYEKFTMVKIFIDFDGTLVDSSERLYRLFSDLVPQSSLTKMQYWDLKRSKVDHSNILQHFFHYSQKQVREFESMWLSKIELDSYLSLDKPYIGSGENLEKLAQIYSLSLLTARQKKGTLLDQLKRFGWEGIFEDILVTEQKVSKSDLIKSTTFSHNDWIVGDTGHDIATGQELDLHTAAVCNGFMSRESLIPYSPDKIFDSFAVFQPI